MQLKPICDDQNLKNLYFVSEAKLIVGNKQTFLHFLSIHPLKYTIAFHKIGLSKLYQPYFCHTHTHTHTLTHTYTQQI